MIEPLLATGLAFEATAYPTVPFPCPLVAEVIVIQPAPLVADQEHSCATLMVIEPVPPDPLKLDDELVTEI